MTRNVKSSLFCVYVGVLYVSQMLSQQTARLIKNCRDSRPTRLNLQVHHTPPVSHTQAPSTFPRGQKSLNFQLLGPPELETTPNFNNSKIRGVRALFSHFSQKMQSPSPCKMLWIFKKVETKNWPKIWRGWFWIWKCDTRYRFSGWEWMWHGFALTSPKIRRREGCDGGWCRAERECCELVEGFVMYIWKKETPSALLSYGNITR